MLEFDYIEWDDDDDLAGNTWHIAASGVTPEEVDELLRAPDANADRSHSTGRPVVFGWTSSGKYIVVVYDVSSEGGITVIRPKSAYEVEPPA